MRFWRSGFLILSATLAAWWSIHPTAEDCGESSSTASAAAPAVETSKLRRPVALLLADDGRLLFAANRRSASISVIDTTSYRLVHELPLGKKLADFTVTADGRYVLAVDEEDHALLLLSRRGEKLASIGRLPVSPYPVNIRIRADGSQCYVTSLWSRRLTIVDLTLPTDRPEKARMTVKQTLDLPFAPRVQLLVKDDTKLIVADGFGGRLGIVDIKSGKLEAVRELPAHNIRGLAVSPDGWRLLVSHQILNDLAETSHNDVHWGVLMSNVLRWVVLDRVLSGEGQILKDSHVHMTGDTQSAGSDPAEVTITRDGRAVIALGGVNEVGFGYERDYSLRRLPIGRRPTAVVASSDGRRAYVANTFGDSVSVVDLGKAEVVGEIPLGPPAKLSLADRGEMLFYNGRLSLDGWMSCHSCHTDGHTNSLLNDNLGDNSFGAPKRVLSLLGVGDTKPWAWNGQVTSLEAQIRKSVTSTMRGRSPSEDNVRALAAYLKTLKPPPSLAAVRNIDPAAIARGRAVFESHQCDRCHQPPTYTSPDRFDVDLADPLGNREYNPPSLRGVSQRERYFHDNRAATLSEVFSRHSHQLQGKLADRQLSDLLAFLQSL